MTIQVLTENDEVDISFEADGLQVYGAGSDVPATEEWKSLPNDHGVTISFSLLGHQVVSFDFSGNVKLIDGDRESTSNLLIARIEEQAKEIWAVREAGVEYTGESTGITPLTTPKPYDPDKIKVRQDKFAVDFVVNKLIARGIIDLNPDFQRKFVWDRKRQSNLIESLMLGIPIPIFYLAEGSDGYFHVIDGLQRLSTLRDFLNDRFPLRNLEHLSSYDGCYYNAERKKRLDTKMLTRIETAQLHFNIIEATSPPDVKYDIFTRLNTGGQPLNNQEVRNCLAARKVRDFFKRCCETEYFKRATGNSIKSKRMEDQEMVLRFAGFYLQELMEIEYSGDMNPFLNEVLDVLNSKSENYLANIEAKFCNAMKNAYHLFGEYSFRKCLPSDLDSRERRPFINKSMFVVWSIALSRFEPDLIEEIVDFKYLAPIVANAMILPQESQHTADTQRYSNYYWGFTSGTSDKKSLLLTSETTNRLIAEHIEPLL